MATVSPPRLYLWRHRTLYLGPLQGPLRLHLAASRLLVSLDPARPLEIRARHSRRWVSCQSALLPVGTRAELRSGGQTVADCHLDVAGQDLALMSAQAGHRLEDLRLDIDMPEALASRFSQWLQRPPEPETLAQELQTLLNPPELLARSRHRIDPRVAATIARIQGSVTENVPLAVLAAEAGLSNSRLVNLFEGQVGIPVRRYRLWHRLFLASCLLASGASATAAAHRAGFSDAAHLSHTYRDILGISPTDLFGKHSPLDVFVEPVVGIANDTV